MTNHTTPEINVLIVDDEKAAIDGSLLILESESFFSLNFIEFPSTFPILSILKIKRYRIITANEANNADTKLTLYAILAKGTNTVKNLPKTDHKEYPGGCAIPNV